MREGGRGGEGRGVGEEERAEPADGERDPKCESQLLASKPARGNCVLNNGDGAAAETENKPASEHDGVGQWRGGMVTGQECAESENGLTDDDKAEEQDAALAGAPSVDKHTGKERHAHVAPRIRCVPRIVERLRAIGGERCYDLRNKLVLQHAWHVERVVAAKRKQAVER